MHMLMESLLQNSDIISTYHNFTSSAISDKITKDGLMQRVQKKIFRK